MAKKINEETHYNLSVSKEEGDSYQNANISTTNVEEIRKIIDKLAGAEETNVMKPEENMPYGEGSVDLTMQKMADDDCGCGEKSDHENKDGTMDVEIDDDGILKMREEIRRLKELAGYKNLEEDWGSSDWTAALKMMDRELKDMGRVNPETIEDAAYQVANHYYDMMGYESAEDAVDTIVQMWARRRGYDKMFSPVSEDADYDYRDEDAGPSDPNEYDYHKDIVDFARKGHSKRQSRIVNWHGDNPLPPADEEDTVFEKQMKDAWERYKLNEDDLDPMLPIDDLGTDDVMDYDGEYGDDYDEFDIGADTSDMSFGPKEPITVEPATLDGSDFDIDELVEVIAGLGGKLIDDEVDTGDMVYVNFGSEKKRKEAEEKLRSMGIDVQDNYFKGSGIAEIRVGAGDEPEATVDPIHDEPDMGIEPDMSSLPMESKKKVNEKGLGKVAKDYWYGDKEEKTDAERRYVKKYMKKGYSRPDAIKMAKAKLGHLGESKKKVSEARKKGRRVTKIPSEDQVVATMNDWPHFVLFKKKVGKGLYHVYFFNHFQHRAQRVIANALEEDIQKQLSDMEKRGVFDKFGGITIKGGKDKRDLRHPDEKALDDMHKKMGESKKKVSEVREVSLDENPRYARTLKKLQQKSKANSPSKDDLDYLKKSEKKWKEMDKAHKRRQRNEEAMNEKAPKGWEGTVKAMKDEPEIDNPWALSHWMKNKGYKSHKTKSGKDKK